MQYYKHQTTGEVYGASERTRPPASFYESRVGEGGKPEFAKVAAPKPGRKGGKGKGGAAEESKTGETGDAQGSRADSAEQGDGGDSEKGGD